MSIFEWRGVDLEHLTRGSLFVHGSGDVATSRIARDMFRAAVKPDAEDVVELGRLPRNAIREADVVDPAGTHIPEPIHETFESDRPALAVLRWSNGGLDDEERFAFRSVCLAWRAARRLLGARRP
ncbi:MAG: hypothetical protein M3138_03565 [Actinomycetota bacterium]|nr:hypothetical protein [Actinomycetota bacterium]